VIDTATMAELGTVETGSGPHGVVVGIAGTHAWVTNTFDDAVLVIDLEARTVLATVAVGQAPNGISYSPRPAAAAPATTTLHLPTPTTHLPNQQGHGGHGHS
jgi:YVTN family beta-propeller protein